MSKIILIFLLVFPVNSIANDELLPLQELMPWLKKADLAEIDKIKLLSPEKNDGKRALLVSDPYLVIINNENVSISNRKSNFDDPGSVDILDVDDDGKVDVLAYGFKDKDGETGIVQDVGIDGQADLRMYISMKKVEAWLQGKWREIVKHNNKLHVDIDGVMNEVYLDGRLYKIKSSNNGN